LRNVLSKTAIGAEEEVRFLRIGPPRLAPKLLNFQIGSRTVERSLAVEVVIAEKVVNGSMKLVCARLGDYFDLPAGGATGIRAVKERCDLELRDSFQRDLQQQAGIQP